MTGTTVGNYRVVSHLGSGGMGVVYKALDLRLQRHVALKVLPAAVSSDAGRRQRFLREAQAASALNDPHIITIHDIFEHEGTDVLVMELVEGRTLREVMQGPVPVDQAVTWARQMADALGLAHGAGIVHRDLKPGNVMVSDRGALKVLDFGLAKVAATANDMTITAQTAAGDVLGTIEYMSPEQARGEPVDHAYLADAHVSLGLAKQTAGDVAAARQALEYALTLDPGNAGAHRGLGDIEDAADRKDQAVKRYERALASDATDWDLMNVRGAISYDRAEYADALVWYRRAADAAPDSANSYLLMGGAHHMLGDFASAAASFQRSIGIRPTDPAYTNLGTALFFQGRYRESVQAFERAVELAPSRAILWGNLADAYRWVPGNSAKAQEAYGRAIARLRELLAEDSGNVLNRSRLALYLAKSGDSKAALEELAQVPTRTATEVNTLFRGAVTYELAGDRVNALAMLEKALDRGYSTTEVKMDPELEALRQDVRFHRLIARFESKLSTKP